MRISWKSTENGERRRTIDRTDMNQQEKAFAARFGREVLGPAVCGFTLWLLDRVR